MAAAASSLIAKLKPFSQGQLNDLVRDFGPSTESSEVLGSRLGEHGILDSGIGGHGILDFQDLLSETGLPEYNPDEWREWRLFTDSSTRNLKCVLLHNGNKFACVPIGHSVIFKEHYLNKLVLQKLRYSKHNWALCLNFKIANFLLGRQGSTPNILVFPVSGTVALLISTGKRRIGRHEKILQWAIKIS